MRRLAGFARAVRAVAFLPDGRLAAGGDDKWVRVLDPTSGECAVAVEARGAVYAVAASPDGRAVAHAVHYYPHDSLGRLGALGVFDPDIGVGRELRRWSGPPAWPVWSLSYSAGGDYLAAACREPSFYPVGAGGWWWNVRDSRDCGRLPNRRAAIVQFAPGGTALAVASGGNVVLLADPTQRNRADRRVWPVPAASPWSLAFTGAESFAVSCGPYLHFADADGSVARLHTAERFAALAASPDGRTLLAGGRSGAVECYDARTRALRGRHDFGVGPVHALAFAPDGLTFAVAGEGGLAVCDAE